MTHQIRELNHTIRDNTAQIIAHKATINTFKENILDLEQDFKKFAAEHQRRKQALELEIANDQAKLKQQETANPGGADLDDLREGILRKQKGILAIDNAIEDKRAETEASKGRSNLHINELTENITNLTTKKTEVEDKKEKLVEKNEQAVKMQSWQTKVNGRSHEINKDIEGATAARGVSIFCAVVCGIGAVVCPLLIVPMVGFAAAGVAAHKQLDKAQGKAKKFNDNLDNDLFASKPTVR